MKFPLRTSHALLNWLLIFVPVALVPPFRPGTLSPVVTIRFDRCGITLPALSVTVVSGSAAPVMSTAFVRSTMPMIGLVT